MINQSFSYDAKGLLVGITCNENEYFYLRDITGNIYQIIDTNGKVMVIYQYDAWGVPKKSLGSDLTEAQEVFARILLNYNPFMYKGYFYDEETGYYYLNSRYYDPNISRFISTDDISYLEPEHINGLNLYVYCYNNPVMWTDSTGNSPEWGTFFKGLGRVVTGTLAVVGGILVIASGVALLPMLIIAGVTIAAGALTFINGTADIGESFTGYNYMRDGLFNDVLGWSDNAYNWYSGVTEAVAVVGSMICGGWFKVNKPRIQAFKNVGSYEFSGTLSKADHMSRPFQSSTLTQRQVIKYGKMIKESGNVYKFLAPGSTVGSTGNWKLVVDIGKNAIYHFGIGF